MDVEKDIDMAFCENELIESFDDIEDINEIDILDSDPSSLFPYF